MSSEWIAKARQSKSLNFTTFDRNLGTGQYEFAYKEIEGRLKRMDRLLSHRDRILAALRAVDSGIADEQDRFRKFVQDFKEPTIKLCSYRETSLDNREPFYAQNLKEFSSWGKETLPLFEPIMSQRDYQEQAKKTEALQTRMESLYHCMQRHEHMVNDLRLGSCLQLAWTREFKRPQSDSVALLAGPDSSSADACVKHKLHNLPLRLMYTRPIQEHYIESGIVNMQTKNSIHFSVAINPNPTTLSTPCFRLQINFCQRDRGELLFCSFEMIGKEFRFSHPDAIGQLWTSLDLPNDGTLSPREFILGLIPAHIKSKWTESCPVLFPGETHHEYLHWCKSETGQNALLMDLHNLVAAFVDDKWSAQIEMM